LVEVLFLGGKVLDVPVILQTTYDLHLLNMQLILCQQIKYIQLNVCHLGMTLRILTPTDLCSLVSDGMDLIS
jgi:hypothetical protein